MRHLSCDPQTEILGTHLLACMNQLKDYQVETILKSYGLVDIQPADWVPVPLFLEILNDMYAQGSVTSFMSVLVTVGMEIGGSVNMPIEDPSLADVLTAWNDIYRGMHRNGDVGQVLAEQVNATHFKLTLTDLYPDDVSYGILYGYAKRFLPPGTQFTIYYDPKVTPRDRGGDSGRTVIHIKWR